VKSSLVFEDAKQYGMSQKTLRRVAADMEIVKDPVGGGRNCKWALPDEILSAMADDDDEAIQAAGENLAENLAPDEDESDGLLTDEDLSKLLGAVDGDEEASGDE
jgi:hypothetical protein